MKHTKTPTLGIKCILFFITKTAVIQLRIMDTRWHQSALDKIPDLSSDNHTVAFKRF